MCVLASFTQDHHHHQHHHHLPASQGGQNHHHHVRVSWPLLLNIITITIITYLPVKEDEEDGKQTGNVVAE